MNQFIEVDHQYRRKLFATYILSIGVLISLAIFLTPIIREYLQTLRGEELILKTESIVFGIIALPIVSALFLIWFGVKVIKDKQYPYKGKKVIRRTKIIEGKRARSMGVLLIAMGILPILLIFSSIFLTHSINSTFIDQPFEYVPRFHWNRR